MAIDKALYQAPEGIDALAEKEQPLEIEVVNPDEMTIGMNGLEITLTPESEKSEDFYDNLAEEIDDRELSSIASELLEGFEGDIASRKDWIQTYVDGLELLGLKIEERSEPWEGACGVYHPLLSEALVKFQAETMMSIFPAAGPVKTHVIGKETPEKKAAAERVQEDMNYELTEVMQEYRPETERMLWGLGLAGNAFKKVYEDAQLGRQVSMYVPAEDMVVPYGASSLESADRITHVMRKTENELRALQVAGFYRDVDLGEPANVLDEVEKKIAEKLGFRASSDDRYKILEMHVNLDLDGYEHTDENGEPTGIALPYIVTIEKARALSYLSAETGNQKMKNTKNYSILSTMGIFPVLVFTVLVLFTLSALMLNLVLPLSANWLMQAHLQTCRVALRPVGCVLKETTHR